MRFTLLSKWENFIPKLKSVLTAVCDSSKESRIAKRVYLTVAGKKSRAAGRGYNVVENTEIFEKT